MTPRPRLLIIAVAAAAIGATIGGVTVAGASGSSGSPSIPSKSPAAVPVSSSESPAPRQVSAADPVIRHVAALLGVSPGELLQALPAVKQAAAAAGSVSAPAAAAALADQLHVPLAQARQALNYRAASHGQQSTKPGSKGQQSEQPSSAAPPEAAVSALAGRLGITRARAEWVLNQLNRMSRPGQGVDPNSAAFAILAAALGKTPTQLAQALDQWKQSLSAQAASPSPSNVGQRASTAPAPTK